jgi:hypothetical protein
MAGGTATKTSVQFQTALAAIEKAKQAVQHVAQYGLPSTDPRHAAVSDPAITAAITALQALQ